MLKLHVWHMGSTNIVAASPTTDRSHKAIPNITPNQVEKLAVAVYTLQLQGQVEVSPFTGKQAGWVATAINGSEALLWDILQTTLGRYYEVKG